MARPEFWANQEAAQATLQNRRRLEEHVELDSKLARDISDLHALVTYAFEAQAETDVDGLIALADRLVRTGDIA